MKPSPFDYAAPASTSEALRLLSDTEREVKVLAGGQSLIPMLNMRLARPELLVDITRIDELDRLFVGGDGSLHIGAAVRQSTAASDSAVRNGWPLLSAAIKQIGHPQIRNRGTVCGSLVHHDPAAELPTVAVALDADFKVVGLSGIRTVSASDFFISTFSVDIEPEELLTEVVFPAAEPGTGWSFLELAQRHGDYAGVGVAVVIRRTDDEVAMVRVVLCGVGNAPVRAFEVEQVLIGRTLDSAAIEIAGETIRSELDPPGDVHIGAEWRRDGAEALLRRALKQAWESCT
ncbi:FAD binding domain-containing protein [Nocardia sp. NPDC004750]